MEIAQLMEKVLISEDRLEASIIFDNSIKTLLSLISDEIQELENVISEASEFQRATYKLFPRSDIEAALEQCMQRNELNYSNIFSSQISKVYSLPLANTAILPTGISQSLNVPIIAHSFQKMEMGGGYWGYTELWNPQKK